MCAATKRHAASIVGRPISLLIRSVRFRNFSRSAASSRVFSGRLWNGLIPASSVVTTVFFAVTIAGRSFAASGLSGLEICVVTTLFCSAQTVCCSMFERVFAVVGIVVTTLFSGLKFSSLSSIYHYLLRGGHQCLDRIQIVQQGVFDLLETSQIHRSGICFRFLRFVEDRYRQEIAAVGHRLVRGTVIADRLRQRFGVRTHDLVHHGVEARQQRLVLRRLAELLPHQRPESVTIQRPHFRMRCQKCFQPPRRFLVFGEPRQDQQVVPAQLHQFPEEHRFGPHGQQHPPDCKTVIDVRVFQSGIFRCPCHPFFFMAGKMSQPGVCQQQTGNRHGDPRRSGYPAQRSRRFFDRLRDVSCKYFLKSHSVTLSSALPHSLF